MFRFIFLLFPVLQLLQSCPERSSWLMSAPVPCRLPSISSSINKRNNKHYIRLFGLSAFLLQYLGCIEVLRSMRSLDFTTRSQITRYDSCSISPRPTLTHSVSNTHLLIIRTPAVHLRSNNNNNKSAVLDLRNNLFWVTSIKSTI